MYGRSNRGCRAVAIQSVDDRVELLGRVADVRGGHDLEEALLAARGDRLHVALEHALERLLLFPLGMLRRQRLDAIEREGDWK